MSIPVEAESEDDRDQQVYGYKAGKVIDENILKIIYNNCVQVAEKEGKRRWKS